MPEYIEREAFMKEQRHLYCENCARRKGMKNGKMRFVYEIGDAPCSACGYDDVLDALEDYPAADVRPVVFCGVCELHGHCYTEDVFTFARLAEENRFCSVGKVKTNGAKREES